MKKMSLSEQITYSTVQIKCVYSDGSNGSGTGFIINLCSDKETNTCIPVIITNNHVVQNSIRTVFEFCKADQNGEPLDNQSYSIAYEGKCWIHHPDANVDLRCLFVAEALKHITEQGEKVFYIPLDTSIIPSKEQLSELSAVEEVLMFGYPIGLSDTVNHKPIIRKGITASHPRNDYQGKKEILLDIASYPGSSGSPVFILNQGAFSTLNGVSVGTRLYFLGVLYGGHQFNAKGSLQFYSLPNLPTPITQIPINLGIIIKSERILEFEDMIKRWKRPSIHNNESLV